jgi:tRNA threonylcarbamoyladenosine biosynthesis protein TsaE
VPRYETHGEAETFALGRRFAESLKGGDVVATYGTLGSGKTKFIQGICGGLQVGAHVVSPTFTIVNEYAGRLLNVYHFDFYRVGSLKEITDLGFEEYLSGSGVCLIEWAEKAKALLPPARYDVEFALGPGPSDREITVRSPGAGGAA